MGTCFHPITLIGADGRRETVEALVDTGSTFTTVPRGVLQRLGVAPFARIRLRLANGQFSDEDVGEVSAQVNDLPARTVICVFGRPDAPPILGAHALEAFLLGVDPDQQRLVALEAWWAAQHA